MFHVKEFQSSDDNVSKYVFTSDNAAVESVLYKYGTYEERTVICCSVMSGCPIGCKFCGTGNYFVRNLSCDEIVYQVNYLLNDKKINTREIKRFQIMFMSMGEPMLNFRALQDAIRMLNYLYPNAALLISTSAPKVDYQPLINLSCNIDKIGLQFSVHESTDEARNKLIPFKDKLTLKEISLIGRQWYLNTLRKPFFNYCAGAHNTSEEDADRLANLFDPKVFECTISVICEKDESVSVAHERQTLLATDFSSKMLARGFGVRTFNPAGQDDIGGGCGQLWYVQQWMKDNPTRAKRRGLKVL